MIKQTTLESMSEQDFQKHVQAVITSVSEKDQNLSQESNRWWRHIHSGYYDFDSGEFHGVRLWGYIVSCNHCETAPSHHEAGYSNILCALSRPVVTTSQQVFISSALAERQQVDAVDDTATVATNGQWQDECGSSRERDSQLAPGHRVATRYCVMCLGGVLLCMMTDAG